MTCHCTGSHAREAKSQQALDAQICRNAKSPKITRLQIRTMKVYKDGARERAGAWSRVAGECEGKARSSRPPSAATRDLFPGRSFWSRPLGTVNCRCVSHRGDIILRMSLRTALEVVSSSTVSNRSRLAVRYLSSIARTKSSVCWYCPL